MSKQIKKILRVIRTSNPEDGGVVEAVRLQQKVLEEYGIEVHIISCDAPDSPWLDNKFSVTPLGPCLLDYGYTRHLLPWMRKNGNKFDAVIVDGLWQYQSFAVWRAFKNTNIPYYVLSHGMLAYWFKYTYPLKHLKKWLYWPWAEYRVLRDARRVIFSCEDERLSAKKSFWLYKVTDKVASLGILKPQSKDVKLAKNFLVQYPHLLGKRIVLFLGRIHEIKGVDILIEAFVKVAQFDERLHLVIAGPDQTLLAGRLKVKAKILGISNQLTWTGMLDGDRKWEAFYAAEVLCLPSHHESFGMVVAEALACGRPVLISNKVNIWREIKEDKAGFVADDTLEGTIDNLNKWLKLTEAGLISLQRNALKCFENNFRIENTIKQLVNIINESGDEKKL